MILYTFEMKTGSQLLGVERQIGLQEKDDWGVSNKFAGKFHKEIRYF